MNLLQIPFIGFAFAWDLSQAAGIIWPLLRFEHDCALCCKPENLSSAKVSRKWIRLIGWLTKDQGKLGEMGRWGSRYQRLYHYCRTALNPMPLSSILSLDSTGHRHWRPPLGLVFKTFPACWKPCLSLLRPTSNYHYLPLFVRELSLNLQRLLKLAVAGWKY